MDVNEKLMFLWKLKKKKFFLGGGGGSCGGGQGRCERFCENSIKIRGEGVRLKKETFLVGGGSGSGGGQVDVNGEMKFL